MSIPLAAPLDPSHSAAVPASRPAPPAAADRGVRILHLAAASWLAVALAGQLLFAAYVAIFYGRAALAGRPADWNQVLATGWIAGDGLGNALLALHLAFAVVVMFAGIAQLLPPIRRRWPALHRGVGRIYLLGAALASLGGLMLIGTRETVGDAPQHVGTSIAGLLILGFAVQAWRHARARRFAVHRRWALRLFLVVSAVFFFRIGLMLWVVLHGGPFGFDPKTFTGPFLSALAFAQFLLPLAVLELYLRVDANGGHGARLAMAVALGALTLATAGGVAAAAAGMWLPRL